MRLYLETPKTVKINVILTEGYESTRFGGLRLH